MWAIEHHCHWRRGRLWCCHVAGSGGRLATTLGLKVAVYWCEKPGGWGRAGYEWVLEAPSGSNSNELTHTHTHQGHKSSQHQTTELELWTGREGLVHDMNKKISGAQQSSKSTAFWCHRWSFLWFLSCPHFNVSEMQRKENQTKIWNWDEVEEAWAGLRELSFTFLQVCRYGWTSLRLGMEVSLQVPLYFIPVLL